MYNPNHTLRAISSLYHKKFTLALACVLIMLSGCNNNNTTTPQPGTPTSVSQKPYFRDVTKDAGIQYVWKIEGKRPLNILQTIGNGCAFLDFDNDGNLDILLVGKQVALYQGDGKGKFRDISKATGLSSLKGHFLGCAVGDYDNDGFPDIYLGAYRGGALLHNEAGKSFRDVTKAAGIASQPWTTSAAFVETQPGSGKLDLVLGNYVVFGPKTHPQLCDLGGVFGACGPKFYEPERGAFYRNLGNGKFKKESTAWDIRSTHGKSLGIASANYDGSGRISIAFANDEVPGDLLRNLPSGWTNVGVASGIAHNADGQTQGGMGIDWGDYNDDGKLDLAVGTFEREQKSIYRNEDGNLFTETSTSLGTLDAMYPYVTFGTKWLDFDNDGDLDILYANGHVQDTIAQSDDQLTYRQPTILMRNINGERLENASKEAGAALAKPIVGRGLAIGDYDNDGRMDALVVDIEGEPLLLHNETDPAQNWLSVKLQGTKGNRDGLGSQITLDTGTKPRLRHCATDGSYMSASDRRVHFGLGSHNSSVTLTVRWTSGRVQKFENVAVNQIITLVEGKQ